MESKNCGSYQAWKSDISVWVELRMSKTYACALNWDYAFPEDERRYLMFVKCI